MCLLWINPKSETIGAIQFIFSKHITEYLMTLTFDLDLSLGKNTTTLHRAVFKNGNDRRQTKTVWRACIWTFRILSNMAAWNWIIILPCPLVKFILAFLDQFKFRFISKLFSHSQVLHETDLKLNDCWFWKLIFFFLWHWSMLAILKCACRFFHSYLNEMKKNQQSILKWQWDN